MSRVLIKIASRQIIDASSAGVFEKNVFDDSYNEFLMQAQVYNKENKFKTLAELIAANPKASSLHYKVGFSIGLYLKGLDNNIPGLFDTLGRTVSFSSHIFEIIESDIADKSIHKISITYLTDMLSLLDSFGEYLLMANDNKADNSDAEAESFILKIEPNVSIISYRAS